MLLTLELLMNDNRRIGHTPSHIRHRIRQLAYFCMVHESDLVCHQSMRMDRRAFVILYHLFQTVSGLSSTEIVDVKEMNCIDALDRMYIKVNVPATDRPTFRTLKGEIATNVLGLCDTKRDFVYVLAGWKGSATDSQILRDALAQENGLQVPKGYPNTEGFLGPYRGQWYHLQEWCGVGNAPTNANEYFNMKHSSARNVIERAFGVLKGRWAILRENLYYPLQVQC
ncbi:hypothetical protein IC582_021319 [Cucumis melo]